MIAHWKRVKTLVSEVIHIRRILLKTKEYKWIDSKKHGSFEPFSHQEKMFELVQINQQTRYRHFWLEFSSYIFFQIQGLLLTFYDLTEQELGE